MAKKRTKCSYYGKRAQRLESTAARLAKAGQHAQAKELFAAAAGLHRAKREAARKLALEAATASGVKA
jgi:hypothetical protein